MKSVENWWCSFAHFSFFFFLSCISSRSISHPLVLNQWFQQSYPFDLQNRAHPSLETRPNTCTISGLDDMTTRTFLCKLDLENINAKSSNNLFVFAARDPGEIINPDGGVRINFQSIVGDKSWKYLENNVQHTWSNVLNDFIIIYNYHRKRIDRFEHTFYHLHSLVDFSFPENYAPTKMRQSVHRNVISELLFSCYRSEYFTA